MRVRILPTAPSMSSSTQIDVNYLSVAAYSGVNQWTLFAGSDRVTGATFPEDGVITPENPTQYASILKVADNANINLKNLTISQGRECAVDINNHVITMLDGTFGSDADGVGNQIFSIKGSSAVIIAGILKGAGNRLGADVLVDNWSDQAYGGSLVDLTNAKHATGRKIKVVKRFFASKVTGDVEILYWQSVKMTAYWYLKLVVRKILKIKVGQKGPSWL